MTRAMTILVAATLLAGAVVGLAARTARSPHDETAPEATAMHARRASAVAVGHAVGHDPRAVASIRRWMALGEPRGASSRPRSMTTRAQDPAKAGAGDVERVVTVRTTGSNLSFEPARLSLKAGTRVRVDYVNDGVLPHNFVVVRNEDDLDALGAAAYEAEATGYVPLDQKDKLIAYTALAAPGTTVSVTFEVPAPGSYTFVCLFPGHYNVMLGTLRALT